jgi:hypothetical protein
VAIYLIIGIALSLLLFQPACSGGSKTQPATGGTPAGSYIVVVQGASGTVTHATTLKLVVQ